MSLLLTKMAIQRHKIMEDRWPMLYMDFMVQCVESSGGAQASQPQLPMLQDAWNYSCKWDCI